MPTLLCYGDSLTWGYDAATALRHPKPDRWPDALGNALAEAGHLPGLEIFTDGARGRTTGYTGNPAPADMNGAVTLPNVLYSHAPIDAMAVMLGTNDIWCDISNERILRGLKRLVEIARSHPSRVPNAPVPRVLLICPPPMIPCDAPHVPPYLIAQSQELAGEVERLAAELGTGFFDAGSVAQSSAVDGVHIDAANTRALGQALVPATLALFDGAQA